MQVLKICFQFNYCADDFCENRVWLCFLFSFMYSVYVVESRKKVTKIFFLN